MSLLLADRTVRTRRLFDALPEQPEDNLLALIGLHARDPRPGKLDLGVGMFRDDAGATPVLRAVKAAEAELLARQPSKSYLGGEGDARFVELLEPILFGPGGTGAGDLRAVQTPGGTGALRLAAELVARADPDARIWIGSPTWPNHVPIMKAAGLCPRLHPFFDPSSGTIAFDAMMMSLADMAPGDVLLLHGCCHNPTGADLTMDQWRAIAGLLERRGAIPLIDLAYQGLGDGLEDDAAGMRCVVEHVAEAMIAYSCDKNFGLYRERVGALWVKAANATEGAAAFATMLALARGLWSMPPDHGAAVVRVILDDSRLRELWRAELDSMRLRINRLRAGLAASHPRLAPLAAQRGMFAMLPISPDDVGRLQVERGIYMARSGRINIAGLRRETIPAFADAIAPLLGA